MHNQSQQPPSSQTLKDFDFERLSQRESSLLQELSGFTFQNSFLGLLKRQYGDTNLKQKFIDLNKAYIDGDDMAQLNLESMNYKKQLMEGTTMIIGTSTLAALIYGICVLPSRRSPVRYTVGGFSVGVVLSYGFWRLQLNKYDRKINQIFKKIVRDQYHQSKGIPLP